MRGGVMALQGRSFGACPWARISRGWQENWPGTRTSRLGLRDDPAEWSRCLFLDLAPGVEKSSHRTVMLHMHAKAGWLERVDRYARKGKGPGADQSPVLDISSFWSWN